MLPYADEVHEHTSVYQLNELDFMYRQLSSDMQEEYVSLLTVFENLEALYICRNVIIVYPDCKSMIDVARQKLGPATMPRSSRSGRSSPKRASSWWPSACDFLTASSAACGGSFLSKQQKAPCSHFTAQRFFLSIKTKKQTLFLHAALTLFNELFEIGRASCRERV